MTLNWYSRMVVIDAWRYSLVLVWCLVVLSFPVAAETVHFRVGCDRDYPPFSVIENGLVSGFDAAVLQEIAAFSGCTVEFRPDSWAAVLKALEEGQVDVVSAIIFTDRRSDRFDFSIPYLTDYYTFFSRDDSGVFDPADAEGKILAILREDASIERFVIPGGLDEHIILTDTYSEALLLVRDGHADYTVAPYTLGMQLVNELSLDNISATSRTLFPVSYRLAVQKGNTNLLFRLNEGIVHLSRTGMLNDLRKRWVPGNIQNVPANHPVRLMLARVFLYIISALVLIAAAYAAGRITVRSLLGKTTRERDCLLAVLDVLPLGLRWQNILDDYFSENRFWNESCKRLKNFKADETTRAEAQRFIGSDGEEYWLRFTKNAFVSDLTGVPVTLFVMEDVTPLRTLEETVDMLSRERTTETARLLVETMVDPASGFFSHEFLEKKLQELVADSDSGGSFFSVIVFNFAVETAGENRNGCYVTAIRKPLHRSDYPCCTADGRLAVLLPGTDADTAQTMASLIIGTLAESGFTPSMCGYSVLEYPGTGKDLLFQSIKT